MTAFDKLREIILEFKKGKFSAADMKPDTMLVEDFKLGKLTGRPCRHQKARPKRTPPAVPADGAFLRSYPNNSLPHFTSS